MPIQKEMQKLPKQWIVNVAYTLIGEPFAEWVMSQIETRNAKMAKERNLMINVDPAIAAAWQQSTNVACKYYHRISAFFVPLLIFFRRL